MMIVIFILVSVCRIRDIILNVLAAATKPLRVFSCIGSLPFYDLKCAETLGNVEKHHSPLQAQVCP